MLFTLADLHSRHKAENALRQSEQRFSAAVQMAPTPIAIIVLDGMRVLDVNDAFTATLGWRREEAVGRTEADLGLRETDGAGTSIARQVMQTGHLRSVDIQIESKDGQVCDYLLSAETVTIHGEHCVLTVMQDITERRQTEAEVLRAIEAVMQDTSWFGQKVVEKLASITRQGRQLERGPKIADLTPRALDVLRLLAQGLGEDGIVGGPRRPPDLSTLAKIHGESPVDREALTGDIVRIVRS